MSFRNLLLGAVGCLVVLAVVLTGCEDGVVLPPSGSSMVMSSTAAVIDPSGDTATSTITAQVLGGTVTGGTGSTGSTSGAPVENVTVVFSSEAGTVLPSQQDTDAGGVATAELTIGPLDPDTVEVTARTGGLVDTVTVGNPIGVPDAQAVIALEETSPASLLTDLPFFFLSESEDPDDTARPITCVRWKRIGPFFEKYGPVGDQSLSTDELGIDSGDAEQEIRLNLAVTEAPVGAVTCDATTVFSNSEDFVSIFVCRNTAPNASIDEGSTIAATLVGGVATVTLHATTTTDSETTIGEYRWDCDNNQADQVGEVASCGYTSVGARTVTLTVEDRGAGLTPSGPCNLTDTDTISVIVNAP